MKGVSRNFVSICLLLFVAQIAWAEEQLHNSLEVLECFYKLHKKCGYGNDQTECAAWILRDEEGVKLLHWPHYKEKYMQVWHRAVPYGALAIAHTHSATDISKPSSHDVLAAKKFNVPIYTIHRKGIWVVTPDGVISQIKGFEWYKTIKSRRTNQTVWFGETNY